MTIGAPVVLDVAQQSRTPMGPHFPELLGDGLHPIAEPEDRDAQIEHPRGGRDLRGEGDGTRGCLCLRPSAPGATRDTDRVARAC